MMGQFAPLEKGFLLHSSHQFGTAVLGSQCSTHNFVAAFAGEKWGHLKV